MRRPYHYLPSVSTIRAVEKSFIDGDPVEGQAQRDPDFVMRQAAQAVADAAQWMLVSPEFGLSESGLCGETVPRCVIDGSERQIPYTLADDNPTETTPVAPSAGPDGIAPTSTPTTPGTPTASGALGTAGAAVEPDTSSAVAKPDIPGVPIEPSTPDTPTAPVALIVAGRGGNGGDALYAGAELARTGWLVFAIPTVHTHDLYPPALAAFQAAGGTLIVPGDQGVITAHDLLEHPLLQGGDGRSIVLTHPTLVIDGVTGLGGRGPLRSPVARVLADLCRTGYPSAATSDFFTEPHPGFPVLAVDIPSGVDPDTGLAHHAGHFTANVTVTFGSLRRAHLLSPACGIVLRGDLEARIAAPSVELDGRAFPTAHDEQILMVRSTSDLGANPTSPEEGDEAGGTSSRTGRAVHCARRATMSTEMRVRGRKHLQRLGVAESRGVAGLGTVAATPTSVTGSATATPAASESLIPTLAATAEDAFITGCRAVNPAEPFTVPLPRSLAPVSQGESSHPGQPLRFHARAGYINATPSRPLEPAATSTKYTDGVVGLCVGSARYPGAAILATHAAVRTTNAMVKYVGACAVDVVRELPEVVIAPTAAEAGMVHAWVVGAGMPADEAAAALCNILQTVPSMHNIDGTQPTLTSTVTADPTARVRPATPLRPATPATTSATAGIAGTAAPSTATPAKEPSTLSTSVNVHHWAPAIIIDAGAITALAEDADLRAELRGYPGPTILTPHGGEARRLLRALGRESGDAEGAEALAEIPLYAAFFLAQQLNASVLFKGRNTVVAHVDPLSVEVGAESACALSGHPRTETAPGENPPNPTAARSTCDSSSATATPTATATATPTATSATATSTTTDTTAPTATSTETITTTTPAARAVVVDTGCSWAATPGSGDALAGILGAITAGEVANPHAHPLNPTLYAGAEAARVLAVASELSARTPEGFAPTSASRIIESIPAARAQIVQ